MRNVLKMAFALLLVWHAPVLAQTWRPIDNPEKFAADVVQTIANGASNDAAMTIVEGNWAARFTFRGSGCIAGFRR